MAHFGFEIQLTLEKTGGVWWKSGLLFKASSGDDWNRGLV